LVELKYLKIAIFGVKSDRNGGAQTYSVPATRHGSELEASYSGLNNKNLEVYQYSNKLGWLHIRSKRHRAQKDLLSSRYPSDDIWEFGTASRLRT
jgi:hypothetical protein